MAFATRTVEIVNERGLHARAAAKFTALAETFACDISVSNGRETVPGRSIMGLLLLAAAKESQIVITASGSDATEAMEALCDLVGRGFDEEPAP